MCFDDELIGGREHELIEGREQFIRENAVPLVVQRDKKIQRQRKRIAQLEQSNVTYRERDAKFRLEIEHLRAQVIPTPSEAVARLGKMSALLQLPDVDPDTDWRAAYLRDIPWLANFASIFQGELSNVLRQLSDKATPERSEAPG